MLCRFEDCAKSIPLDVVDGFKAYNIQREIDSTRGKERSYGILKIKSTSCGQNNR